MTLTGWHMTDNDPTHVYAFPSGTTIAAHGYLAIDMGDGGFGFGLGSTDEVHLYNAADQEVDSHGWATADGVNTLSRCPNGTGAMVERPATRNAVNNCP